ncbi:MAG: hypothetical protein FD152_4014 [Xanthobacteraceae bacterium]|nr:MAG: hypothetical protein FD152_4014 [Xanthobacteraceae bacterium]
MIIKELLARLATKGKPETSTKDTEALIPDADEALQLARANRAALLLTGDDADVIAAERRVEAASIRLDRLRTVAEEIGRRHAAAVEREDEALLAARLEAAGRESRTAIQKARARVPVILRELRELRREVDSAERAVAAVNDEVVVRQRTTFAPRPSETLSPALLSFLTQAEVVGAIE